MESVKGVEDALDRTKWNNDTFNAAAHRWRTDGAPTADWPSYSKLYMA